MNFAYKLDESELGLQVSNDQIANVIETTEKKKCCVLV
jgi:hypothetical protein